VKASVLKKSAVVHGMRGPNHAQQKQRSTVVRAALLGVVIVAVIAAVLAVSRARRHGPRRRRSAWCPAVADREVIAATLQPLQQYCRTSSIAGAH